MKIFTTKSSLSRWGTLITLLYLSSIVYSQTVTVLNPTDAYNTIINNANPGDVFRFNPGNYDELKLVNLNGNVNNPIIIESNAPNGVVNFRGAYNVNDLWWNGNIIAGEIRNCSYIVFKELRFSRANEGVHVFESDHLIFYECEITDTGQVGIKFSKRTAENNTSTDYTHHIDWLFGKVWNTGNSEDGPYGEGFYIGQAQQNYDLTHHIWIEGAEVWDTNGGEAFDVKPEVNNITIRNNIIHDIEVYAIKNVPGFRNQVNSGAIQVIASKIDGNDKTPGHHELWIEGNTINGVAPKAQNTNGSRGNGISVIGRAGVYIKNNTITNVVHDGIYGILNDGPIPGWPALIDQLTIDQTTAGPGRQKVAIANGNVTQGANIGNNPMSRQTWWTPGTGGGGCGATISWANTGIGAQTGSFTAEWDMVPGGNNMDGALGLSDGTASAWGDLATAVRFNNTGKIDARNGGGYAAQNNINYTANTNYHIRQIVDLSSHTYDIFVTPAGGNEITLGTNYAFRTGTEGVTQLTHRAINTVTCGLTVSNFTTTGGGNPGGSLAGTYYLKNKDSGKRMTVTEAGTGKILKLGNANGTGSDFEFEISEVAGDAGKYFIKVNGLVIRNDDCNNASGTFVETHNGTGDCARWEIIENGSFYNLKNKDNGLFARNDDCADQNGNEIELTSGTGGCAQWTLEPVAGGASARLSTDRTIEDVLDTEDKLELAVFPNPVEHTLTIRAGNPFTYRLIDTKGRVTLSGSVVENSKTLDVSGLKHGLYILTYKDKDAEIQRKISIK